MNESERVIRALEREINGGRELSPPYQPRPCRTLQADIAAKMRRAHDHELQDAYLADHPEPGSAETAEPITQKEGGEQC